MNRSFAIRCAAGGVLIVAMNCGAVPLIAQQRQADSDLSQMNLEELTKVEVTSVARKDQELFKTPAAVFVITREDIHRSGISSIPELLRMVPGMQVAQIYANEWAVSARGFNGRFANKMLVLIDGRSIYSEIYSGVYWDQNDLLIENIDRVEVIRGPGGTLWGANAVNGIINIITLKSDRVGGGLVVGEAGRLDDGIIGRFGGNLSPELHYQSYIKSLHRSEFVTETGAGAKDPSTSVRAGARVDWEPGPHDTFALHGDMYRGHGNERIAATISEGTSQSKIETSGGYVLGHWTHESANYEMALQAYYHREDRGEISVNAREDSFDLDYVVHLPRLLRNEVSAGAGYRITTDQLISDPSVFGHPHHSDALYSLFFEDEFAVFPNRLTVYGGFKLTHNSYTGFEVQPGLRGIWTPNPHHSLWAAVSRAVRTPSVQELDLHFLAKLPANGGIQTYILAEGNPLFHSEVIHAYEAGYRQDLGKKITFDIAGFFNKYSDLRSQIQLPPYQVTNPEVSIVIPITYENLSKVRSDGIETAVSWKPYRAFAVSGSYSWINHHSLSMNASGDDWSTPTNTLSLRSNWDIGHKWSIYSSVYTVGKLPVDSRLTRVAVRAYVRADAHVSYRPNDQLEMSAGVDNLERSRHREFDPEDDGYSVGSQVPRNAFVKLIWSF